MGNVQTPKAPSASRGPDHSTRPTERAAPGSSGRAPRQVAVTVRAEVPPANVTRLERVLRSIGQDPAGDARLPFGALPRVHFARLLLLPGTDDLDGRTIGPQLLYMADVDAPVGTPDPVRRCLEELVDTAGDGLDVIFGPCDGYPRAKRPTRDQRLTFLEERRIDVAAGYVNTIGRSLEQIRREAALRDAIGTYLDTAGTDWSAMAPRDVRAAIKAFVAGREDLAWALQPPPTLPLRDRIVDVAQLLAVPAGAVAFAPLLVPALTTWALLIRLHELRDEADTEPPTREHAQRLAALEDHGVQNAFSAVGSIKPGFVRQATTDLVTRGIDLASRHVYRRADLAGVQTIHFARWVFLDDRRRMIFASNYDGSLEGYNNDFIHIVWWGLNAVFSNGVGYPRTRWLFFGGARQEEAFKHYLRRRQVPTQVWYSAYPDLTAVNIDNNAYVRAGLHGRMSTEETRAWLRRL